MGANLEDILSLAVSGRVLSDVGKQRSKVMEIDKTSKEALFIDFNEILRQTQVSLLFLLSLQWTFQREGYIREKTVKLNFHDRPTKYNNSSLFIFQRIQLIPWLFIAGIFDYNYRRLMCTRTSTKLLLFLKRMWDKNVFSEERVICSAENCRKNIEV